MSEATRLWFAQRLSGGDEPPTLRPITQTPYPEVGAGCAIHDLISICTGRRISSPFAQCGKQHVTKYRVGGRHWSVGARQLPAVIATTNPNRASRNRRCPPFPMALTVSSHCTLPALLSLGTAPTIDNRSYLWWTAPGDRRCQGTCLRAAILQRAYGGQYVFVIPVDDLVIVHLARMELVDGGPPKGVEPMQVFQLLLLILAAAPANQ